MMLNKYQRVVDLINDPVCQLMMTRDRVNPSDLLRMMMAIQPVVLSPPLASDPMRHSMAA